MAKTVRRSWRAAWRGAPFTIRSSVALLTAMSLAMLFFGTLEVATGASRPLSVSEVGRITRSGHDVGAMFGVGVIFVVYVGGILLFSLIPAALGVLFLRRYSAARVVVIGLGLLLIAIGFSAADLTTYAIGIVLLVAVALAYLRASRAYFGN